jgi:hypothetical protein
VLLLTAQAGASDGTTESAASRTRPFTIIDMKTSRLISALLLASACAFPALAQPVTGGPLPALDPGRGETTLTLDIGAGIRAVLPSRVTVPIGESLRIVGPSFGGRPVQWLRNNQAIPGATSNPLVIPHVTSADAGIYVLVNNEPNVSSLPSQALVLGVGPTDRLLNLSTRGNVGSGGDQGLVSGFVVAASSAAGKKMIVRAIGPSLALFDVPNPLRRPVLKIYDGSGRIYEAGFAYPAVVGGPTYESDLAESLVRAGAFPLPPDTADAVVMMPFVPGSYTAQVTSGDGTSGTVLLEIYEVP